MTVLLNLYKERLWQIALEEMVLILVCQAEDIYGWLIFAVTAWVKLTACARQHGKEIKESWGNKWKLLDESLEPKSWFKRVLKAPFPTLFSLILSPLSFFILFLFSPTTYCCKTDASQSEVWAAKWAVFFSHYNLSNKQELSTTHHVLHCSNVFL